MSSKQDEAKVFNKCRVARKLLGNKKITQQQWADLTGIHKTVVARRETKKLGIGGTAASLYDLVRGLCSKDEKYRHDILAELEAVEGDKSEGKAFAALIVFALDRGHRDLVRRVMAGSDVEIADKEEHRMNVKATLDVLSVIQADLEQEEKHIEERELAEFKEFAEHINGLQYKLKRWVERRFDDPTTKSTD